MFQKIISGGQTGADPPAEGGEMTIAFGANN